MDYRSRYAWQEMEMKVRSQHHSECDRDWEDEVDRMVIGQSTMTDEEIEQIRKSSAGQSSC